ncbi:hypothetical protein [uncultured Bacteroides sp.]|uniref:glycosyl hydrolase family 95 catalytic domain-containing protein n=1 Tax=uncultured Bacteroides sp. TaxID=162156 RepID=UPI002614323A|nr:hypothetical protein [uncultured Bacteroides sp.]
MLLVARSPLCCHTGVVCKGKQTKQSTDEKSIVVRNADEAWIVVSAKTSYPTGEIYETEADRLLNEALRSNFSEILPEAVRSYQTLFNRAGICLPENETVSHLTTDERIENFQKQDDPSLAALYYNYGRYLLISSTRPGSLPPNLQGLWANATGAPWNGDYHTNINVQMKHWPVEQANLSELYTPLIDLVKRLVDGGKESAKAFYGLQAKGWVLHTLYAKDIEKAIRLLPPHQISKEGYLMEWLEDYEETDIHHRHVSHLYGLHPGNQISVLNTPDLAEACRH